LIQRRGPSTAVLLRRALIEVTLAQYNGATLIVANDVERVLADIDSNHGDGSLGVLGHGVLLVVGAPDQL
jgi:hypothetical protein